MEELKGRTLAFVAHSFSEVAALSHDLVGLADGLLSGLAKVCSMHVHASSLKSRSNNSGFFELNLNCVTISQP